jgi:hypothetical protein
MNLTPVSLGTGEEKKEKKRNENHQIDVLANSGK